VGLLDKLTHPRSQLTELREFEGLPKLPGIHWEDGSAAELVSPLAVQDDPTDVGDLSSFLEASD
jgi:hypothetical protein